ncbi:spondin domain-containing protein [Microvirga terrestris]|uniref:Spondin domain-containing protein n=1 Tax=Microvirga terrestris TaxID=2791024 RepID=A0ABS0HSL6_9HYPH|nr:spondin domain-containing protein [Microvirga terrestris]MBF9196467.1 spondin domain-containing protein [Microvirga terrestris]
MYRSYTLVAALALGLVSTSAAFAQSRPTSDSMNAKGEGKRIRLTIENLTTSQTLSPPVFVSHNSKAPPLFKVGEEASFGLMRIAEEGNAGPLLSAVVTKNIGEEFGAVGSATSILPGQSRVVELEVTREFPMVSGAAMLVMTNDGFTGINGLNAYELSSPRRIEAMAYDAGTEKNNERKSALIAMMGTDRDPENGKVQMHTGIRGDADAPADWKFDPSKPVARITVTPVTGMEATGSVNSDGMMKR